MNVFLRYAAETTNLPNHFRTIAYDARILYILSGRGALDYGDERAPLEPCSLCYYPAGAPYYPRSVSAEPMRFVTLNFDFTQEYAAVTDTQLPVPESACDPARLMRTHERCGEALFHAPFVTEASMLYDVMRQIAREFQSYGAHGRERAAALLQYALYRLCDQAEDARGGLYRRTLDYLEAHYAEPLDNRAIARALNYHPNYLNAAFKRESGATLHRFLRNLRLQKAARLLRESDMPVAEIARAVGFENADHFSAAFSRRYGLSPTQCRKKNALV